VALIEGDHLLLKEPKVGAQLYRYSLAFPPAVQPLDDAERKKAMTHRLDAYIETGLLALRNRKLGVPRAVGR
jgi:hypothetical protein